LILPILIFLAWIAFVTFIAFIYVNVAHFGLVVGSIIIICEIIIIIWLIKIFIVYR
jgi:hypothetical protein